MPESKTTTTTTRGTNQLPIDRGWAWVILLCYFLNGVLMMGYYKSFGIVFVEMLRKFKSSASATSLLIGIQSAFISIGGLLTTTVLMTYFSGRQIVICGGCLLSSGIVLTIFAPSLAVVIIFQSILVGLGVVMIFSPGQTLVCQYFNRRRGIALSLGMAGTSVGALVTPPVLRLLLDTYGLNGALLVHGAIVFNVIVFGALMRPLESYMKRSRSSKEKELGLLEPVVQEEENYHPVASLDVPGQSDSAETGERINTEGNTAPVDLQNASKHHRRKSEVLLPTPDLPDEIVLTRSGSIPLSSPFHSHELSSQVLRQRHSVVHRSLFVLSDNEDTSHRRPECEEEGDVVHAKLFVSLPNLSSNGGKENTPKTALINGNTPKSLDNGTGSKLNGLDSKTTGNLEDRNKNENVNSSSSKLALKENCEPLIASQSSGEDKKGSSLLKTVASIFEVAMFKEVRFYLVMIVSGLSILPTILPISYLPALADDRGLSDTTASYLLMVAAVCGIVARVVFGLIIDSGRVSINYVAAFGMIILAVGMQFVSFIHGEALFMFFSVFLGLFGDAYFFVLPIWIVAIYGQVMFRKAFGFSLLLEGMFLCGGSPFCGWLRDYTGSFSAVYHFLGACSFVSAIVMLIDTRLPPSKLREEYVVEVEENV